MGIIVLAYIYKISNDINQKVYIGKTECDVTKRWKEHCREYKKDRCKNRPLYRAMNKYGVDKFHIETIEETDDPEIREIYWIGHYDSYHNGYNATRGGDGKKYLDYDAIVSTYLKLQNITETALVHGVSADGVTEALIAKHIQIKKSSDVIREKLQKKVAMCDKSTNNIIRTFDSVILACQYLVDNHFTSSTKALDISSHVSLACGGVRKSAYGFSWKYLL